MSRTWQPGRVTTPRRPHSAVIVAAILVALYVAGEFVTIAVQTAPRPALPRAALQPVLRDITATEPASTWTNASPGATGGSVDLTGRKPLIVAACQDGGSIAIELSDTTSITIDCTDRTTVGPVVLDNRSTSSITVETAAGNPRYIVELLASTD